MWFLNICASKVSPEGFFLLAEFSALCAIYVSILNSLVSLLLEQDDCLQPLAHKLIGSFLMWTYPSLLQLHKLKNQD